MTREQEILSRVQMGDVILTVSELSWWKPFDYILRPVYAAIQWHQERKYPGVPKSRTRDVHATIVTNVNQNGVELFSYEWPRAILKPLVIEKNTKYRICRYKPGGDGWTPEEYSLFITLIRHGCKKLLGNHYDPFQMVDIALKQLFPWAIPEKARIFDLGKWKKVCSVGVLFALLHWWRNYWRDPDKWDTPIERVFLTARSDIADKYPRPLKDQHIETCAPADFCADELVNDPSTFEVIWED
jgi:hypothetical protein